MPKKILLAVLSMLLILYSAPAQEIKFKAMANEIFGGSVNCLRIMEDSQGFIWIGTYQGVFKYDGAHSDLFQHNPFDSLSINHNFISDILQENDHIYVTTWGNGSEFNKISIIDHSVSRITAANDKNLAHRNILKLNNGYFVCGGERGIIYFNVYNRKSFFIPNVLANPIIQTDEGDILIAVEDYLLKYIIAQDSLQQVSKTKVPGHIQCTEEIFGSRIFGTSSGLFSFDAKWVFPSNVTKSNITDLLLVAGHLLWIGTVSDGLFRWDLLDNTLLHFMADEREGYLHSNAISCLFEDSNHLLWIGTEAGPFITDLKNNGISKIKLPTKKLQVDALPLFQADPDQLLIGTGNELHVYDIKLNQYNAKVFPIENSNTIISNRTYDTIWISTVGSGAYQLVRHNRVGEFSIARHYKFDNGQTTKLSSALLMSILVDDQHNVWFGSYVAGIDILKKNGTWMHLSDSLMQGIAISSLLQSKDKSIWIGKLDKGLTKCVMQKDGSYSFKHYTPSNSDLKSIVVTCLAEDKSQNIWIGTMSGGLYKLNPFTETFKSYSTLDGLKSNNIMNLICDSLDNVWCSTSDGLACLDKGSQKFSVYTVLDGLPQNGFSFYSSCLLKNGNVAFGTTSGIALVDPDSLKKTINQFKPFVSRILLQNNALIPGHDSLISENPNRVRHLRLNYYQDLLTFEFSNGYYINPDRVLFAYRLEGYQGDWVELGKSNLATFTRLPAGQYLLKIRSSIDEGKTFSYSEDPLQITVLPPWWQTWWFRSLLILASLSLIYYIFKQRTEKLLAIQRIEIEKTLALDEERSRISRDMHDDLGSGLSAIHLLSNYLSENAEDKYPEFSNEVDKIRKSSEELNESIREIIWTVNTKDDNLTALALFIRRYGHELQDKTKTNIHIHSEDPLPEIQMNGVQRKHVFLCIKEALNNALKHGKPSEINIYLSATSENIIAIRIVDNGSGFSNTDPTSKSTGNGLSNMKERMNDIGGIVEIESGSLGTEVKLIFKP